MPNVACSAVSAASAADVATRVMRGWDRGILFGVGG
jgi:hypothetical protein